MTLRPIQMYRPHPVWTLPGVAIAHRTVDDIVGTSRQSGMGVKPGGDTATPPTADRRTSIGAILDFVTAILIAAFGTASGSQETNPREAARRARRTL